MRRSVPKKEKSALRFDERLSNEDSLQSATVRRRLEQIPCKEEFLSRNMLH